MALDLWNLAVVLAGSLTVLLQTFSQDNEGWSFAWVWILIITIASLFICVPSFIMELRRNKTPETGERRAPSIFLFVLWIAGALPATFAKPFALTGNGYFGTWAALYASTRLALADYDYLKEPLDRVVSVGGVSLPVLLVASLVTCLQTVWSCGVGSGWCNGNAAWVLICSAVSSGLSLLLCAPEMGSKLQSHLRPLSLFLLTWWCAGAVVTTFEKPYDISYANGYFGCWAATLASARMAAEAWGVSVSRDALSTAAEATGRAPKEILVLFMASLVTLIASAIDCGDVICSGLQVWAILCSFGSLAVCSGVIFYTLKGGWVTDSTAVQRLATVLLAWWIMGTTSMTFHSPFFRLSNGYLSSWTALAASIAFASKHAPGLKTLQDSAWGHPMAEQWKELCVLMVASIVLPMQAILDCVTLSCGGGQIFALLCGLASLGACVAVFYAYEKLEQQLKWIVFGIFSLWCLAVYILTFHHAYVRTGNVYFACWFAVVASGSLVLHQFPQLKGYATLNTDQESSSASPQSLATVIGVEGEPRLDDFHITSKDDDPQANISESDFPAFPTHVIGGEDDTNFDVDNFGFPPPAQNHFGYPPVENNGF